LNGYTLIKSETEIIKKKESGMRGIITAALLTMPLSLFAEGGTGAAGATAPAGATGASAAPTTNATAPASSPAAMAKVTCVGKMGAALSDEQKKALETAGVKSKTMKTWKAQDVSSVDECKGAYTIENGAASKVTHKKKSH
jgi:hypothetical protein